MLLNLIIFYLIYLVDIFSVGNANEQHAKIDPLFLRELLNARDELIKVKHELELRKANEANMTELRAELQQLNNKLNEIIEQPEKSALGSAQEEEETLLRKIMIRLVRFGVRHKQKFATVLAAIRKLLQVLRGGQLERRRLPLPLFRLGLTDLQKSLQ